MTDNEFNLCLMGQGNAYCADGERLRYKVARMMEAWIPRIDDRSRKSRMAYIASRVRTGQIIYKRPLAKARKDMETVRTACVDGVSLTGC